MQCLVGGALTIAGAGLLIAGINPWNWITDRTSGGFAEGLTRLTTWYIVLGIATFMLGVLMLFNRLGRRSG